MDNSLWDTEVLLAASRGDLLEEDVGLGLGGAGLDGSSLANSLSIPLTVYRQLEHGRFVRLDDELGRWQAGRSESWDATDGPKEGSVWVFRSGWTGSFVCAVRWTEAEPDLTITPASFVLPNEIGPFPKAKDSFSIPRDSPRILVGCAEITANRRMRQLVISYSEDDIAVFEKGVKTFEEKVTALGPDHPRVKQLQKALSAASGALAITMVLVEWIAADAVGLDPELLEFEKEDNGTLRVYEVLAQRNAPIQVLREQYWKRTSESYTLAPFEEKTVSQTRTSGRQVMDEQMQEVAQSVSASASASWGPVTASVNASLNESSATTHQVTTTEQETVFESTTVRNQSSKPVTVIYWQLMDVLSFWRPADGRYLGETASYEDPVLVSSTLTTDDTDSDPLGSGPVSPAPRPRWTDRLEELDRRRLNEIIDEINRRRPANRRLSKGGSNRERIERIRNSRLGSVSPASEHRSAEKLEELDRRRLNEIIDEINRQRPANRRLSKGGSNRERIGRIRRSRRSS